MNPVAVSTQSKCVIPSCLWLQQVLLCSPLGTAPSPGGFFVTRFSSLSDALWGQDPPFLWPVWVPVAAPAIAPSKPGGAVSLSPSARLLPDPHLCLVLDLDLNHEPMLCSTCHVLFQRPMAGGDAAAAARGGRSMRQRSPAEGKPMAPASAQRPRPEFCPETPLLGPGRGEQEAPEPFSGGFAF